MLRKPTLASSILVVAGGIAAAFGHQPRPAPRRSPTGRGKTQADFDALAKAQAKRERKAAKLQRDGL